MGVEGGLEEFWLATDAYIYGYPLVTMEMTRRVLTNVAEPVGTKAPMGQIIKLRHYPNASFRDVTAPNADTLYTTSFFDVGKEPWVLSIPDMKGRYSLMPMLDGWTNVFHAAPDTGAGIEEKCIDIAQSNFDLGKSPFDRLRIGDIASEGGCTATQFGGERSRKISAARQ